MTEPDLPTDVASCHALIHQLREELEETKRKLSVHVENQRREYEARYGKGVTPQSLLAFGERIARKELGPPQSMSEAKSARRNKK